jgi:predicted nucleotidyltransferase
MSGLQRALGDIVELLEGAGLDYMVLGGFALPFYGRIRSTLDLDVAAYIPTEEAYRRLLGIAGEYGLKPTFCSYRNPVSIFVDENAGLEIELWLRPDGVNWNGETLSRRRRVESGGINFWVIGPEDFIVSKLARPDRMEQDELDVKSVLVLMGSELDSVYLAKRAREYGVDALLFMIRGNDGRQS